jgi:hypothetical protein
LRRGEIRRAGRRTGRACGAMGESKGWGGLITAPSKIAFGLRGREGTAHFRRLTPPSFAALKPVRGLMGHVRAVSEPRVERAAGARERAVVARTARRFGMWGDGWDRSLSAADAAFVRGTEPAAIFIHADVPQGHGGSLENRRWVVGPRGNRSLSAADAAFVRGTEPAAVFIHADVPQGHGGSLENRRWVVGPRGNRSLSAADAAFVRGSEAAPVFIPADVPQGHGGLVAALRAAPARLP